MKKIVGIIAAVAVLATSVFAADVAAKVKLDGSLFNFDGTKKDAKVSGVSIQHNTDESWNPVLSMSTSTDNAGASVGFYVGNWDATKMGDWNHGYGIGAKEWKIWFKPLDALRLNIGRIDASLNTESIDWSNRIFNYDDWGYQAVYSADALNISLALHTANPGDKWLHQDYDAAKNETKTNIEGLALFGSYSADFGTISFLFDANSTFKDIKVGAGYKNTFGDINLFADVAMFYTKDRKSTKKNSLPVDDPLGLGADVDVKYNKDAFGVEAYARFKMNRLKSDDKVCATGNVSDLSKLTYANPMELMLLAKVTYKIDPVTVYGYFKSENLLAKRYIDTTNDFYAGNSAFISEIRIGANGNVGIASWNVYGKIETGNFYDGKFNAVKFSVPVEFSVGF